MHLWSNGGGWGQSVLKIRQCNGLPDIHDQLRGYLISLCTYLNLNTSSENMNSYLMSMYTASCSLYLTTRGVYLTAYLGTSSENMNSHLISMCISSCSLHLTAMGVYLTPYLDTSCENINSFPHFWFGSQSAHHLSTSSETGGISDSLSEYFISKYEIISSFQVWVSVCTTSEHFI